MGGGRAEATVARCSPLYVVIVPKKETLHVGLVVVDDADPGRVVNHVAGRSVEEVRRSVAQPCTAAPRRVRGHASPDAHGTHRRRPTARSGGGAASSWSPDTRREKIHKNPQNVPTGRGGCGPDAAQTRRENPDAKKKKLPLQHVPTGRGTWAGCSPDTQKEKLPPQKRASREGA